MHIYINKKEERREKRDELHWGKKISTVGKNVILVLFIPQPQERVFFPNAI